MRILRWTVVMSLIERRHNEEIIKRVDVSCIKDEIIKIRQQ